MTWTNTFKELEGGTDETGVSTTQEGEEEEEGDKTKEAQYLVHTEDGGHRYIPKNKWSCLTLDEAITTAEIQALQELVGLGEVEQENGEREESEEEGRRKEQYQTSGGKKKLYVESQSKRRWGEVRIKLETH